MTIAEEYQKERENLELQRRLDWSTYSKEHVIAGVTLEPMTVQTWFDMLAIKSPMLYNEAPTLAAIVDYVWKHNPKKTDRPILKRWRLYWLERRIVKTLINKKESAAFIHVLRDHLKTSLDEFPLDSTGSTSNRANAMSAVTGEASMIDELSSRYSMTPDQVLAMPIRRAFSLQRTIRLTTIPNYKILEPDSLRAIKSKFIQSLKNGG